MPFHTRNSICTPPLYHTRKNIPTTNYESIVKLRFHIRQNHTGKCGLQDQPPRKKFFSEKIKLFSQNPLTKCSVCAIILSVNGTNRLLGICVMAAQQTLTLYVGVRISHPQPVKRAESLVFMRIFGFYRFMSGLPLELS